MLHYNRSLLLNCFRLALHECSKFLLGLLLFKLRVRLYSFDNLKVAVICRIVLKYIHNEALFNCLLHCILVEWTMSDFTIRLLKRSSEHLKRFILWRSRKCVIVRILHHLTPLDNSIQLIFQVFTILSYITAKGNVHFRRH